jgi:hypothetical protein
VVPEGRSGLGVDRRFSFAEDGRSARLDVGEDHPGQPWQADTSRTHLFDMSGRGDDRAGVRVGQADLERVGHELREQGLGDSAQLENAQEGEVKIRHAVEEETNAVAGDDAQIRQRCRPDVAVPAQIIKGEVLAQPAVVLPDKSQAVAMTLHAQPIGEQSAEVERLV